MPASSARTSTASADTDITQVDSSLVTDLPYNPSLAPRLFPSARAPAASLKYYPSDDPPPPPLLPPSLTKYDTPHISPPSRFDATTAGSAADGPADLDSNSNSDGPRLCNSCAPLPPPPPPAADWKTDEDTGGTVVVAAAAEDHRLGRLKVVYMVTLLCLGGVLQGIIVNGLINVVISSLEKR